MPGGRPVISWTGYSAGLTQMIGGQCRQLAQGFVSFGFASVPVRSG